MFGMKEILKKQNSQEPLTEAERFKILQSKRIDNEVKKYIASKLKGIYIKILDDYEGTLLELMSSGQLEGWCWQTTETAIVFFNDNDYIARGNLYFDKKTPEYYHSWLCFNYKGIEYVLDPCLNILCQKEDYTTIFRAKVKGLVYARRVEEALIKQVTPNDSNNHLFMGAFWEMFDYEDIEERTQEVIIPFVSEDINMPLYRNGAGYNINVEKGRIRKLTAHYYDTNGTKTN